MYFSVVHNERDLETMASGKLRPFLSTLGTATLVGEISGS